MSVSAQQGHFLRPTIGARATHGARARRDGSRSAHRLVVLAAWLAIVPLLLPTGCRRQSPSDLKTVNTSDEVARRERKKRLNAVRTRVLGEVRALRNLHLNRQNYVRSALKVRRMAQTFSMFDLVPLGAELPTLTKNLRAQLASRSLKLVSLELGRVPAPRTIPKSFVGRRAFVYRPGDIVGRVDLSFEIDGATADAVRDLFEGRLKLKRLIIFDKIRHRGQSRFAFAGSVYFFFPFSAPRHELPHFEIAATLREANLGNSLAELARDPQLKKLADEIANELRGYDQRLRVANESLRILSGGHLLEARWDAFRRLSTKHDAQVFERLYRGPAPSKRLFRPKRGHQHGPLPKTPTSRPSRGGKP